MAPDNPADWYSQAHRTFRARLWTRRNRRTLPASQELLDELDALGSDAQLQPANADHPDPWPDGEHYSSHAEVVSLVNADDEQDSAAWLRLHQRFTAGGTGNAGPFSRCLSVLAEHGARTCVIELLYVCLDYKSEVLSFYAQLDQRRYTTTVRLHFFVEQVAKDEVHNLSAAQSKSYLGYIVCRDGNLPLVGRTLIKTPTYIDTAAQAEETVHFFGQQVSVSGMPFMQQDERLAVCSQVAVWAIHYAAYRAGLVQRRLVADIVALSGAAEPMRPSPSDGLITPEVTHLLRRSGLSARSQDTPNAGTSDFPTIATYGIAGFDDALERTRALFPKHKLAHAAVLDDAAVTAMSHIAQLDETAKAEHPAMRAAMHMFDLVLAHFLEPYIRSNMPVYGNPPGHAVVICGINNSVETDDVTFFVHDDQYGPYLATRTLMDACLRDFQLQGYRSMSYPDIKNEPTAPDDREVPDPEVLKRVTPIELNWPAFPADRARALVAGDIDYTGAEYQRSIEALVLSGPSRLVLAPCDAEEDCMNMLFQAHDLAAGHKTDEAPMTWRPRVSIMMGIDYKQQRRRELLHPRSSADGDTIPDSSADADLRPDADAAGFFATLHLAEWVLVIEDGAGAGSSGWEVVYDATSGELPIMQMVRYGAQASAQHPLTKPAQTVALANRDTLPWVQPPTRVGKR